MLVTLPLPLGCPFSELPLLERPLFDLYRLDCRQARTAVLLDASNGLRVGELLGLKWEDVDFEKLEINVTRSVVKQKITRCKMEASRKPIPLDAELADVLLNWKLRCVYPQPGDWVFASPKAKGKRPYWAGALFRAHLKPALKAAQIPGDVGWHTLRHTFGTLMKANGEDIKTIQELLRHSKLQSDGGHLHASHHPNEACCPDKTGEDDFASEIGGCRTGLASRFFLLNLSEPSAEGPDFNKSFGLLASPTGFEPVLPP